MKFSSILAASSATLAAASPHRTRPHQPPAGDVNPFEGKTHFVDPVWTGKLTETLDSFIEDGDLLNAARTRSVFNISTFVWISSVSNLPKIEEAIASARAAQEATGEEQIVGLVLYDLPNRDCSAGESAGEFEIDKDGLNRYKAEFVDPYVAALEGADDLTFAIVLEPDAVGNLVTNTAIELCEKAIPAYKEGIAYAVSNLQADNIHLYIDASHGGWLGWADNLDPTAVIMAEILEQAGANAKIRGVSINVSNYNPYNAAVREPYTEWSPSYDESHYATSLAAALTEHNVPAHFIVDQGRVHLPEARAEWGEWCNVSPAGFGPRPSTVTDNEFVDSIVWIKPGGESDGQCGLTGAPRAGAWFNDYVKILVANAQPCLEPTWIDNFPEGAV
ncbi:hypothetical protein AJ80_02820 [Polytolypa hystricis UAMH7299]|uniref:Glucanase n=1 Tax=Polytolypa hystricis (strain UAMH7299) TaxID=1447883 RepID=A0A2B7YQZ0_POLH7|nr:hypothetical protein AJ80_02820 [Polytolypa hystricis UAMH7299]